MYLLLVDQTRRRRIRCGGSEAGVVLNVVLCQEYVLL